MIFSPHLKGTPPSRTCTTLFVGLCLVRVTPARPCRGEGSNSEGHGFRCLCVQSCSECCPRLCRSYTPGIQFPVRWGKQLLRVMARELSCSGPLPARKAHEVALRVRGGQKGRLSAGCALSLTQPKHTARLALGGAPALAPTVQRATLPEGRREGQADPALPSLRAEAACLPEAEGSYLGLTSCVVPTLRGAETGPGSRAAVPSAAKIPVPCFIRASMGTRHGPQNRDPGSRVQNRDLGSRVQNRDPGSRVHGHTQ